MNFFYVVFITLGSFFILNLFIGVIIENFSKLKQQVKTNKHNNHIFIYSFKRTFKMTTDFLKQFIDISFQSFVFVKSVLYK